MLNLQSQENIEVANHIGWWNTNPEEESGVQMRDCSKQRDPQQRRNKGQTCENIIALSAKGLCRDNMR